MTFGHDLYGGNSATVAQTLQFNAGQMSASGAEPFKQVASNPFAFAALKSDGQVIAWGDEESGGSLRTVEQALSAAASIESVAGSSRAFAAVTSTGDVIVWGNSSCGGDFSSVSANLSGVVSVRANDYAFAALKADGSVVPWGDSINGGSCRECMRTAIGGTQAVHATARGFIAARSHGPIAWGPYLYGGFGTMPNMSGVDSMAQTVRAYALRKRNGAVVVWGDPDFGGDAFTVQSLLRFDNVAQLVSTTQGAFAALTKNGRVVVWGSSRVRRRGLNLGKRECCTRGIECDESFCNRRRVCLLSLRIEP